LIPASLIFFRISKADSTHFTRKMDKDLFVYQIYVNDIIFGSTNASFCEEFSKIMTDRFEMSMMGELKYFLDFQIKQLKDDTFISQTKYTHGLLKKFGKDKDKPIKTPMGINGHLAALHSIGLSQERRLSLDQTLSKKLKQPFVVFKITLKLQNHVKTLMQTRGVDLWSLKLEIMCI
jgi:hypothetical protein